jgi:hypothetical protein
MKQSLKKHDLVLTDCSIINEYGSLLTNSFFNQQKSKKGFTQNLIRNSYMGCCMAFKRKILDHILPFPNNLQSHDQWIGLIAEKYYSVYFLNEQLVQYRRHGGNYSFTSEKSRLSILNKINHRIKMFYNVYNR